MPSGAPELLSAFSLTPGQAAGWTLFAYLALGVLLEPPLLAWSQGRRARPMMLVGLGGIALSCLLAAAAPSFWVLLAALLLYGPSSGLGTQLAEAALMTERANDREATLARWMLFGLVGDLLGPIALAGSVALGFGVRGALFAAGVFALLQVFAAWRAHPEIDTSDDDEEEPHLPIREALREGLRTRSLLAWSLAVLACSFLDELFVAFGALHLESRLGGGASARAVNFAAFVLGGVGGTVVLERLGARLSPSTWLLAAGTGSFLFYVAWLLAPGWETAAALLVGCGFFSATHYPLLTARAYASLPHRPATVAAIASLTGSLEVIAPLLIAAVADRGGVFVAVCALALQPLVVILAGARTAPRGGHETR